MSERRWQLVKVRKSPGLTGIPKFGGLMTDAEVLAEMGGKRVWVCWQYGTIEAFQHCDAPARHHSIDANGMRCGWYQIVKEADDE